MIIKWRNIDAIIDYRTKWHRWFAWYPVRIDDYRLAWLCFVKRKGSCSYVGCNIKWSYDYEL